MSFHAVSVPGSPVVQSGSATLATVTITAFTVAGAGASTGYVRTAVVTTGFAIGFTAAQESLILNPAGPAASGTVTMAISPIDGQFARISTSNTFSAFTVLASPTQTISGAVASLGANQGVAWQYSGTTWFRIY